MDTTHKTQQLNKEIMNKLISQYKLLKHPTKKYLVFIDGDLDNQKIENLAWFNRSNYQVGVEEWTDSTKGTFRDRIAAHNINDLISKGAIVRATNNMSAHYPATKNEVLEWNKR